MSERRHAQGTQVLTFTFDEESSLPLWVQLRNRMAFLINSGHYQPGEKLPTVRKLAADLHIAYNTVSKAYMGLERDGYVATVRGSGVFVSGVDVLPDRAGQVDDLVDEFVKSCVESGVEYEEIPKLVSKAIRRVKRNHEDKV